MKTKIKVGDRVKCYVSTTKLDGEELIVTKHWALEHINKWSDCAIVKPQDYFDNLVKGI